MPYTKVSRVEYGKALLDYVLQEKGHNGNAVRNMMKSSVAMNDCKYLIWAHRPKQP